MVATGLSYTCVGAINTIATSSWQSPTAAAPGGNVSSVVTLSPDAQIKMGTLGLGGLASFGNATFSNKVRIADGTQGEFYALVSDANGTESWKPLPSRPVLSHQLALSDCPAGSTAMTDRGLAYCGYWVNTGAASYCKAGDVRIAAVDTGTSAHKGGNHGVSLSEPNGCIGWEGPSNFGGPGCAVLCRATTTYK